VTRLFVTRNAERDMADILTYLDHEAHSMVAEEYRPAIDVRDVLLTLDDLLSDVWNPFRDAVSANSVNAAELDKHNARVCRLLTERVYQITANSRGLLAGSRAS
jgi:hypothetical protein